MPKERDPIRIALLLRLLTDTASDVVLVMPRVFSASAEPDDLGLDKLLPSDLTRHQKRRCLTDAMAEHLRNGGQPNRVEVPGDREMQLDPAVFYEFRFLFGDTRVYVKSELKEDDPTEPVLIIKSVKRQN